MSIEIKKFLYSLSHLIFQWSLVYLLVLFFMEDLKPFMVSSQFSPHWIILAVIISSVGLLRFAKYGLEKEKKDNKKINKIDLWLINIFSLIVAFMWLIFLRNIGLIITIFLGILIFFLIKRSTLYLLNSKYANDTYGKI